MRKFYLVPSTLAGKVLNLSNQHPPPSAPVTPAHLSVPPELLIKGKIGSDSSSSYPSSSTPSFHDKISMQLHTPLETVPSEIILEFLKRSPIVKWNEDGVLISPVPGLNLIQLLKYLIRPGYTVTPSESSLIMNLNRIIPFPLDYIRNQLAINDIIKSNNSTSNKKNKQTKKTSLPPTTATPFTPGWATQFRIMKKGRPKKNNVTPTRPSKQLNPASPLRKKNRTPKYQLRSKSLASKRRISASDSEDDEYWESYV